MNRLVAVSNRVSIPKRSVTPGGLTVGGRRLMVGVDRLDYSKGLVQRFRAYERFETHPENRNRVTFMLSLNMPLGERRERHQSMLAALRRNSIHGWHGRFVDALRGIERAMAA